MKTVRHTYRSRDPLLHIETDFGIVNIRIGLRDVEGNPVTSVEIIPDGVVPYVPNNNRTIELDGHHNNRLIAKKP